MFEVWEDGEVIEEALDRIRKIKNKLHLCMRELFWCINVIIKETFAALAGVDVPRISRPPNIIQLEKFPSTMLLKICQVLLLCYFIQMAQAQVTCY